MLRLEVAREEEPVGVAALACRAALAAQLRHDARMQQISSRALGPSGKSARVAAARHRNLPRRLRQPTRPARVLPLCPQGQGLGPLPCRPGAGSDHGQASNPGAVITGFVVSVSLSQEPARHDSIRHADSLHPVKPRPPLARAPSLPARAPPTPPPSLRLRALARLPLATKLRPRPPCRGCAARQPRQPAPSPARPQNAGRRRRAAHSAQRRAPRGPGSRPRAHAGALPPSKQGGRQEAWRAVQQCGGHPRLARPLRHRSLKHAT